MGKHRKTHLEIARDELFSHVQRCEVLQAEQAHREEWLAETMEFIAERYPELTPLELAQVKIMGERYIRPAIPHGREATARNRDEWQPEAATA